MNTAYSTQPILRARNVTARHGRVVARLRCVNLGPPITLVGALR